jgi:hypothetical protein
VLIRGSFFTKTNFSQSTSKPHMPGYMHIMLLSRKTGTHDATIREYQVNYANSGLNYVALWDEERLAEFLLHTLALEEQEARLVMARLHGTGNATLGDIDLPSNEATLVGMEVTYD